MWEYKLRLSKLRLSNNGIAGIIIPALFFYNIVVPDININRIWSKMGVFKYF